MHQRGQVDQLDDLGAGEVCWGRPVEHAASQEHQRRPELLAAIAGNMGDQRLEFIGPGMQIGAELLVHLLQIAVDRRQEVLQCCGAGHGLAAGGTLVWGRTLGLALLRGRLGWRYRLVRCARLTRCSWLGWGLAGYRTRVVIRAALEPPLELHDAATQGTSHARDAVAEEQQGNQQDHQRLFQL